MKKQKVIIIGGGVGGLGTAIQLAKKGFSVTIFEKNERLGGRCDILEKNGYHFDTGPTFLVFPEIYRDIFKKLGEKFEDHLKLLKIDPGQQIIFDDNRTFCPTSNMSVMRKSLESFEPGSYKKYLKFLKFSKELYENAMKLIITRDFEKPIDFINLKNLRLLKNPFTIRRHDSFMKKYFKDPRLRGAFTFQDSYIGLSPFTSPAIYSVFPYTEITNGVWMPKGGMYEVVKALTKIAKKHGVSMRLNTAIKKIIVKANEGTGVVTEKGKVYESDIIVVNASLPYAYDSLLPESHESEKLKKKKYSCSTLEFFWGLKKVYPALQTHNIFLASSYKESYEKVIEKQELPGKLHFYVHAPSRIDTSRKQGKKDSVSVIVPVGHLKPNDKTGWNKKKLAARKYVIQRLKDFGLKDFEENIDFEMTVTPIDWERRYNLTKGATLGLHHNFRQMAFLRPSRQHKKFKNVYFVGSNTHPGSGVPTVLLSSYFTSQRILRSYLPR